MPDGKTSTDDQQFLVQNKREVLQILNDLAKHKAMLNASFNQGTESFLTSIIAVNDATHVAYLDIGRDETFNARLVASGDVTFTYNGGVEIYWTSRTLKIVTLTDGQAISIGLPDNLVRIQRREYFRHPTPMRDPVICKIPVVGEEGGRPDGEKILELPLFNISVGGVGVIATGSAAETLSIGAQFDNCKMEFPGVGTTNLTLCVRHIKHIELKNGTVQNYVGLEFVNPSRGNQALIQRYTFVLESESLLAKQP